MTLFMIQLLNGLQFGILLFLLAAGLTLIFGIMDFINLAHGSFYMRGAYFAATLTQLTGSFLLACVLAFGGVFIVGLIIEQLLVRRLYVHEHLAQVLATVGLIFMFDAAVQYIWGVAGMAIPVPEALTGQLSEGGRLVYVKTAPTVGGPTSRPALPRSVYVEAAVTERP